MARNLSLSVDEEVGLEDCFSIESNLSSCTVASQAVAGSAFFGLAGGCPLLKSLRQASNVATKTRKWVSQESMDEAENGKIEERNIDRGASGEDAVMV